ncbi:MAG: spore germination protein, partial [Candidatus Gallimonas sp.]
MITVTGHLKTDCSALKKLLPAEDILTFSFRADGGGEFTVLFADAVTDKELLGEQVVRPLLRYDGAPAASEVGARLTSPELKRETDVNKLAEEVLNGNPVLLWEGADCALVAGLKKVYARTVSEPPTDVAVKGPREGFVEDVKINASLVRRRLKSPDLRLETVVIGRRSRTTVQICYLDGIAVRSVAEEVKKRLEKIDLDVVPDSSYLSHFLAAKPRSLLKQVGTTEKPDIFCAKLAEGRVGILADGSPIALTVPYLLVEDFQSSEDYFVPTYRATFTRLLRVFALLVAVYLPAFYISAQL